MTWHAGDTGHIAEHNALDAADAAEAATRASADSALDVRLSTAELRLLGIVNVKSYGAVGNNVADDSGAIQAAIDALGNSGGEIIFPPGQYRCLSRLKLVSGGIYYNGIKFRGLAGSFYRSSGTDYGTAVQLIAATDGMTLVDHNDGSSGIQCGLAAENIAFVDRTPTGHTATLVNVRLANFVQFDNCSFFDADKGIIFDSASGAVAGGDASWAKVDQCRFSGNNTAILAKGGGNVPRFTVNNGAIFVPANKVGIDVSEAADYINIRTKFDTGANAVCIWQRAGRFLQVNGSTFEMDQGSTGVRLGDSAGSVDVIMPGVIGSAFQSKGTSTGIVGIDFVRAQAGLVVGVAMTNMATGIKIDATHVNIVTLVANAIDATTPLSDPSFVANNLGGSTLTTGGGSYVVRNAPTFVSAPVYNSGLQLYNGTDNTKESAGAGSPESSVTAVPGATYHRRDGDRETTLYVKEGGTGNTGWFAVLTKLARQKALETGLGIITETIGTGLDNGTTTLTSGTAYWGAIGLAKGDIVTKLGVKVFTNGATLTRAELALFDSSFTLLKTTGDVSSSYTSGSANRMQMNNVSGGTYTVPADGLYYIGVLFTTSSGTIPTVGRITKNTDVAYPASSTAFRVATQTGFTSTGFTSQAITPTAGTIAVCMAAA